MGSAPQGYSISQQTSRRESGTLSASTLVRLRSQILNGEILPGHRLNLDQLRLAYNVSLSPLREALSRLASEGLVIQAEDHRGYQVAPVSPENLAEVTNLRKVLEVVALRQSIEHGDDAWETEIVATVHHLSKLSTRNADNTFNDAWEDWHRKFHGALIAACKAPVLLQFCDVLYTLSDRYRRNFLHLRKTPRDVRSEHRAIADAALQRNADQACMLMQQHIGLTARDILDVLPLQLGKGQG